MVDVCTDTEFMSHITDAVAVYWISAVALNHTALWMCVHAFIEFIR